MLPPKAVFDVLATQASRLFSTENPLSRPELETQFRTLLQGAFNKLDLVGRDEFDAQMLVLARTRARLEALEARVAELEARVAVAPAETAAEVIETVTPRTPEV
ncbi:MAG: accessory factor UbiK family protein [Pseudomonas sp.]